MKSFVSASSVALMVALVALAGCAHKSSSGISHIVKGKELGDIPVPSSFEFEKSESYEPPITVGGEFRSWRGHYRGYSELGVLAPWYINRMREHGWTYSGKSESAGGNTRELTFLKQNEIAQIKMTRRFAADVGAYASYVVASVHPRGPESYEVERWVQMASERDIPPSEKTLGPAAENADGVDVKPASLPSQTEPITYPLKPQRAGTP